MSSIELALLVGVDDAGVTTDPTSVDELCETESDKMKSEDLLELAVEDVCLSVDDSNDGLLAIVDKVDGIRIAPDLLVNDVERVDVESAVA
jgi:hypothetical protein